MEKGELLHPLDWLRKTKWVIKQEIIWDRMIAGNIRGWRFWQVEVEKIIRVITKKKQFHYLRGVTEFLQNKLPEMRKQVRHDK